MRSSCFILFAFWLLNAGLALAQFPNAVGQLEETKALWNTLSDMKGLPGKYQTQELNIYSVDYWHSFLKRHGEAVIDERYATLFFARS